MSAANNKTNAVAYEDAAPETTSWPAPLGKYALTGLAGDVVRAIAPQSEADPVAILASFLVAFGNLVGRGPHYRVEADRHAGNLFNVLVGQSAKGRKGVSIGHIRNLFKRVDESWVSDRIKSGLSSGEGVIWDVRDRASEEDEGVADKRLFIQESEFATVLRRMEREGNTLSAVLREAWDGHKLSILTKNSPCVATDAHISVLAHTTADEIRRYLARTEMANGFANRFLFFCVRRSQFLPYGGKLDEKSLDDLAARIRNAVKHAGEYELSWDAEGAAEWADVYPELSKGLGGLVGAITGRAEAQVVRLALLYALLDGASHVRKSHLLAAIDIFVYAYESAAYIFGDSVGDPMADAVLADLRAAGEDGLSKNELHNRYGRHREQAARLSRALDELARANRISSDAIKTDGRPETRYFVAAR